MLSAELILQKDVKSAVDHLADFINQNGAVEEGHAITEFQSEFGSLAFATADSVPALKRAPPPPFPNWDRFKSVIRNQPKHGVYPVSGMTYAPAILRADEVVFQPGGQLIFNGGWRPYDWHGGFCILAAKKLLFKSIDGRNKIAWQPPRPLPAADPGRPGRHGAQPPKSTTGDGERGGDGEEGGRGGGCVYWLQPNFIIIAGEINTPRENPPYIDLEIDFHAYPMAKAGDGGRGGNGGNGGTGRDGEMSSNPLRCANAAGAGGSPGAGGRGGDGNNGYQGRNGGQVALCGGDRAHTVLPYCQFTLQGSLPGAPGQGGQPGVRGELGVRGETPGVCGSNKPHYVIPAPASRGENGVPAAESGAAGTVDKFSCDVDELM